jgi:hypothetical protein
VCGDREEKVYTGNSHYRVHKVFLLDYFPEGEIYFGGIRDTNLPETAFINV